MHRSISLGEWLAFGWTMAWILAAVALHFRLVGKLRDFGVDVPWYLQNQPWVESEYVRLCRERKIDPWPAVATRVGVIVSLNRPNEHGLPAGDEFAPCVT